MEVIKKYGGYIGVLLLGLLIGYFFFGEKGHADHANGTTVEKGAVYTCAMHPEVRKGDMGTCPLCGMDLTKGATETKVSSNRFQMSEDALALANVETTTIGLGSFDENTLQLSGKITTNERTDAVQTSIFDGRIEALNINYVGQYIKKGKKLGTIYAPDMYLAQDKLLTSASYRETHEKLFASSRNTLGLWKLTDAQIDEVLKTGKPILNFPIFADVSGTVTEVLASEGNFYEQGDALFRVSNLYTVWAVFDAYESQLPMLRNGQEITITSKAFQGEAYTAKIDFIEPVLNTEKRTVSVRATMVNKSGALKPGMFVEGRVAVAMDEQVLTVPKSAVLWTGKRSLVYIKPDSTKPSFEMVEVNLGNVLGDSYIVINGLSSGDEVVTNGTFTVDAAAQLSGKKSMMSQNRTDTDIEGSTVPLPLKGVGATTFETVFQRYVQVKEALVASKPSEASLAAKELLAELSAIDTGQLPKEIVAYMGQLKKWTVSLSESNQLAEQRKAFKPLSEQLIHLATSMTDLDKPLYVQFCPMADGNKGATWISLEEKIRNPYFGDAMLQCGTLKKTLE